MLEERIIALENKLREIEAKLVERAAPTPPPPVEVPNAPKKDD